MPLGLKGGAILKMQIQQDKNHIIRSNALEESMLDAGEGEGGNSIKMPLEESKVVIDIRMTLPQTQAWEQHQNNWIILR